MYYQLREAVRGMGEACRVLETPVVSGNVSLYNENPSGAIHPTPVIGMVGVIDDVSKHVGRALRREGTCFAVALVQLHSQTHCMQI